MTAHHRTQEESQTEGGFWQALIGLVDRPSVAMRYAVEHTRTWWILALVILASLVALTVVSAPFTAQVAAERIEAQLSRLDVPEEQLEQMSRFARMPDQTRLVMTGVGGGLVVLAIGWVVWATVLHFSALTLGGESSFPAMFSVVVWSGFPGLLRNLMQAVYIGVTRQAIVNQGLSGLVATGSILTDATNPWWGILSSLDLCLLWQLLLAAVGFSIVAGFSRLKSTLTVVVWWVLSKGLGLIPVLVGRGLMSRFMGG